MRALAVDTSDPRPACQAGSSPASIPVAAVAAAANASTPRSSAISSGAWHRRRQRAHDDGHRGPRDAGVPPRPEPAASNRLFRQQLNEQMTARRAERQAQRELARTRGAAGHQQRRRAGAGDEQHGDDGTPEREQQRPRRRDGRVAVAHRRSCECRGSSRGNFVASASATRSRSARAWSTVTPRLRRPNDGEAAWLPRPPVSSPISPREGEKISPLVVADGNAKSWRHDADDGARHAVQRDHPADHGRIARRSGVPTTHTSGPRLAVPTADRRRP